MSERSRANGISADSARMLADDSNISALMRVASEIRDEGFGRTITYSRKVFIPLTHLCRDSCHYCTFARSPKRSDPIYKSPEDVLAIIRAGQSAGCTEALFTLGDKPELRYRHAREALRKLGHESTLAYLKAVASLTLTKSKLLPHLNPGVMSNANMAALRPVSASMGLMLETTSNTLVERGRPHHGSPDKEPRVRLQTIADAGKLNIPFTSGLLVGIGETRLDRVNSLIALRDLHDTYGHLQEIIIQPFRAKPGTRMAHAPDASRDELLWTIAVARLIFGKTMSIQTPPNLAKDLIGDVVEAGINDWGGISPITADFVNPEAPWPHVVELSNEMQSRDRDLVQRLPLYPAYIEELERWADRRIHSAILGSCDSNLLARDSSWAPGQSTPPVQITSRQAALPTGFERILTKCDKGTELTEDEIVVLFSARGKSFEEVCKAADSVRSRISGDTISYVVNRNINYTNVCSYHCTFCAFSKNKSSHHDPVKAYDLDSLEISRRVREAWGRGATEVCMQGGIHPNYTGDTYLAILDATKRAVPDMHVHAFSPLEIHHGASTLGVSLSNYLLRLRDAGLGTLPGTAAEILDDDVRRIICPDKLTTEEWCNTVEATHRVGLKTTATIMFGHVDRPFHWARHLLVIRRLQERTGGFTEFVPLPFVHMEAPMFFNGRSRSGPTWRETVLMHAVSRLVLNPVLTNIQVSWVKLGIEGAKACLNAGANDLGGTLMNESISRAAGSEHGQELQPSMMDQIISSLGRDPVQRTTLYTPAPDGQRQVSYHPGALASIVQTPARKFANVTRLAAAPF